jgi:ketosteroid isomerase-like protein
MKRREASMRLRRIVRLAAVWLVACAGNAGAGPQAPAPATTPDGAAIRTLIAAYAKSVDTVDTNLAATIWADTPDVSFIYPRGHERGWGAIKVGVYEQAMGQTFSERRLAVKDIAIHCYGDSAWAEFYWDFTAKLRKDGSPVTTHGRETQVYWKLHGTWRLVHVHYSGMPVTGERQGF